MGGINCPPALPAEQSAEMARAYVNSLAQYCDSLFSGTASFFAANAKIEQAVLTDGSLSEAIELLQNSENALRKAQSQIGAVSSLYEQMASGEHVDFMSQLEALDATTHLITTARMELELMPVGLSVQEALWARPELTENFIAAMNSVNAVTSWQANFATTNTVTRVG